MGGWLETDNRAISVQLNLTGTATGTELGKIVHVLGQNIEYSNSTSSRILIIHQNHSRRLIRCIKVCIGNKCGLIKEGGKQKSTNLLLSIYSGSEV